MTVQSVRQHCYTNGVEWIRMVRMLELPEPPADDLRRRLAKRRKDRFRRAIFDPFGRRRRAFKVCTVLGMLDEIERTEAAKTPGGESEACPQPSTS
jgi:hypothetical protein